MSRSPNPKTRGNNPTTATAGNNANTNKPGKKDSPPPPQTAAAPTGGNNAPAAAAVQQHQAAPHIPGAVMVLNSQQPHAHDQQRRYHEYFQILLQDMGLDFKSYQNLMRGDSISKAVSNQFVICGNEALSCTEPTLGLLILILHSAQHSNGPVFTQWLRLYRDVQASIANGTIGISEPRIGMSTHSNQMKISDMASACVKTLDGEIQWENPHQTFHRHAVQDLIRRLFVILDDQSGLCGQNQSPSMRRVQSDPKGMLCNLYLSGSRNKAGGGCQQGFLCNQIHLTQSRAWENRGQFFTALGSALRDRGVREAEVHHRVKDALFYAKYANKVTLKVMHGYIIFFKTTYTRGRLNHALGRATAVCPAKGNSTMCTFGESCEGVHIGDTHGINAGKSSEPLDPTVSTDLDKDVDGFLENAHHIDYVVEERRKPSAGSMCAVERSSTPVHQSWAQCAASGGAPPKDIDPKLLDQLANVSRSPCVPRNESGGMTPVLDDIYRHGFESE
eukprot:PhM_4_TR425/c0_g1_i1/m.71429